MKEKKKETSNIVIYFCMVLLLFVIILPPVLRKLAPKDEVIEEPMQNKVVLLTCRKRGDNGLYNIESKTKFVNNKTSTVTITYTVADNNSQGVDNSENIESPPPSPQHLTDVLETTDVEIFRNLLDANVREDGNSFSIVMSPSTVQSNKEVESLAEYFQALAKQTDYYENAGYSCTKLEA